MLAPLAMMAAIFYLSGQPGGEELAWWEVALRKLGHFGGYALLCLLWAWALVPALGRSAIPAAVAISILYAASDEFHQTFVDERSGTPADVALDALGALTAAAVLRWHLRRRQREAARTERGKDAGSPAKRAHLNRA